MMVDTSVWIEVFKKRPLDLEKIVPLADVVTCPPVIQEVLQGFRDERAFQVARESLLAMQILEAPMRLEVFEAAADLYRLGRRTGITIRSSVDCLIAACAIRNGVPVLHKDRDFAALAKFSGLRHREL